MTTKFQREDFRSSASGHPIDPGRPSRFANRSPKQQLLLIYIGILFFCVVIVLAHLMGFTPQPRDPHQLEGEGIVTEKEIRDLEMATPRYFITIELLPEESDEDGAAPLRGDVEVPGESYSLVKEGMSVSLRYVKTEAGDGISIQGIGVLESALENDIPEP